VQRICAGALRSLRSIEPSKKSEHHHALGLATVDGRMQAAERMRAWIRARTPGSLVQIFAAPSVPEDQGTMTTWNLLASCGVPAAAEETVPFSAIQT